MLAGVDPGRSVTLKRRPDYWGRDLAVNRGFWNFDTLRFDYYRDVNALMESFKKGLDDVRLETDPGRYMAAGFEAYEQDAIEQLAKVWPWRWRRIAQLQERIRIARRFSSLAAEAIIAGRQAIQELETPPE